MRTGPERTPHGEMPRDEVLQSVMCLEGGGVQAWLDGGWAVDTALGEQNRVHTTTSTSSSSSTRWHGSSRLSERGYEVGRGEVPTSVELVDAEGRQVDVHPVVFTPEGDGIYRMEDGKDWVYPAAGFAGEGHVLGRRVRCLTPEVQILCHSGYEPHLSSYDDVWALSRRFGIPVPDGYRCPRESYERS